jgi:MFS family permease
MSNLATAPAGRRAVTTAFLTPGTRVATALAVLVAQVGLAIPAVLNGLFQQDLHTTSAQLTWISDAFLVPVTLLELTFGVLGDLFGRKRLLIGGSLLMAVGELLSVLTPSVGTSNHAAVATLWTGQALTGIGAAVLFPTSLAMVAAGTHTVRDRARGIAIWAAALSSGGFVSPLLGGLVTKISWGSDPNANWRWAFVAVLILALASAAVAATAQNSSAPEGRSLDWPGQITIAVSLFALLFAVIQGATSGWSSPLVIGGFIVAAVFFAAFIAAERRSPAPLLRLSLFGNRAFAVSSLVTVLGMFAFLGTAYSTSIRLSAIQEFSPLETAVAFVLLQGFALVLMPVTAKVIHSYNPRWALGAGFLLIAVGDFWIATQSATDRSLWPIVAPLVLVGVGFAFALSGVTAVAVNTVPNHLAGMAAGTTSQLRDFGFTLGPAVIGAVALSLAAAQVQDKLRASPALQAAMDKFSAGAPPEAVGAVNSGPLGANAVAGNPIQNVAFHALDHAYAIGYLVCGLSALAAAVLAAAALGGAAHRPLVTEESLHD